MVKLIAAMCMVLTSALAAAAAPLTATCSITRVNHMESFTQTKTLLSSRDPRTTVVIVDIDHTLLAYQDPLINHPWLGDMVEAMPDLFAQTDPDHMDKHINLFTERRNHRMVTEPAAIDFVNDALEKGFTVIALSYAGEGLEDEYAGHLARVGCNLKRSRILCRGLFMRNNKLLKGQFFARSLEPKMADPVFRLPNGERISFKDLIVIDDSDNQILSFIESEEALIKANLASMHLIRYSRYHDSKHLHPIFHKGAEGFEDVCFAIANHMRDYDEWPDADKLHQKLWLKCPFALEDELLNSPPFAQDPVERYVGYTTPRRDSSHSDASADSGCTHGTPT